MLKKSFGYFLFILTIYGLSGHIVGYFMPIYFKTMGFSGGQIGFYFALTSIASIVLALPMGLSTDRHSLAAIFVLSFFLMGLSYVAFLVSRDFAVFCLFALAGSFGSTFFSVAQNTMFFKISGANNLRAAGQYQLLVFVASGIGMLVGGWALALFSFEAVFVFTLISHGVLMVLAYFLPRTETVVIKVEEYRRMVLTPKVLFVTLIFFLASLHWGAETVSYGPFLKEGLGLTDVQTGLYTGLGFVMVGVGAYAGVLLLERRWIKNVQTLLALGLLLAGVFHILMCVPHVGWSFVFRLGHEIGDGFIAVCFYHGIARVFQLDKIGGGAAFVSLWRAIGSFISALAFGYVGEAFGPQWSLIISGVILALIPLLLLMGQAGHVFAEPPRVLDGQTP